MSIQLPPIPELLSGRPRDHRGYPIPFSSVIDADGKAYFTLTDPNKALYCIKKAVCTICGKYLAREAWFLGGAKYMLDPNGAVRDPPTHYQCITFALQTCPYLSSNKYHNRLPTTFDHMLVDQTPLKNVDQRYFIIGMSRERCRLFFDKKDGMPWLVPQRPFETIEYWSNGVRLTESPMECVEATL